VRTSFNFAWLVDGGLVFFERPCLSEPLFLTQQYHILFFMLSPCIPRLAKYAALPFSGRWAVVRRFSIIAFFFRRPWGVGWFYQRAIDPRCQALAVPCRNTFSLPAFVVFPPFFSEQRVSSAVFCPFRPPGPSVLIASFGTPMSSSPPMLASRETLWCWADSDLDSPLDPLPQSAALSAPASMSRHLVFLNAPFGYTRLLSWSDGNTLILSPRLFLVPGTRSFLFDSLSFRHL